MRSRRRVGRAVCCAVETLERRSLLTVISWTGGGDGTSWNDGLNWSTHGTPGSLDDAVINVAANPTVQINTNVAVKSLVCAETLTVSSGVTLTLLNASSVSGTLELDNVTLAGAGDLTISGTMNWINGELLGAGDLIVAAGGVVNVTSSGFHALSRTAEVGGTFNLDAPQLIVGHSASGEVNVKSGGNFRFLGDHVVVGSGPIDLEAGGTISKTAGTGAGQINVALNTSGGAIGATSGTIDIILANFSGTTTLSSNLQLVGGTYDFAAGSTFNGAGTLRVPSGSATFTGTPVLPRLIVEGGTVTGTVDLTVTGTLTWINGEIHGAAKLIIPSGALVNATTPGIHALSRTLELSGTFNDDAGQIIVTYSGAGAINVKSGGVFNLLGDHVLVGNGPINLLAGGLIHKTAGSGGAQIITPLTTAGGTINASSGVITTILANFSGATTLASDLQLVGGTYDFAPGATFPGVGTLIIPSGTAQFTGTPVLPRLVLSNGSLAGTTDVTVTGAFDWISGEIHGTGKLIVPSGGTLNATTPGFHALSRTVELSGTLNDDAGQIVVTYNGDGAINVKSGGVLKILGDHSIAGAGPVNLQAGGTIRKTGGSSAARFSTPLNTSGGTIDATSGTIETILANFGGATTLASDLDLPGGVYDFAAGSSFVGPGTMRLTSGASTFSGTPVVPRLQLSSGALAGGDDVTVTGTMDWVSGAVVGDGDLIIPAGATLTISSAGFHDLSKTIDVSGTLIDDAAQLVLSYTASGAIQVRAGGVFDVVEDHAIQGTGAVNISAGGLFRKTGGLGNAAISAVLTNMGRVEARSGSIVFNTLPANLVGAALIGGTWLMRNGGIEIPGMQRNEAIIELEPGAVSLSLSNLDENRGQLLLRDGGDFSIAPLSTFGAFVNGGVIDLSPGSELNIAGHIAFSGVGQPLLRSEISGPGEAERGILRANGSASLFNSSSPVRFDPDLVNGYNPAAGTRFDVIIAGNVTDDIDAFFGGTTPSGLPLLAGKTNTALYTLIGTGTPPPAPSVLNLALEYQTREAIVFDFNTDVSAFLARNDYVIQNLTTGATTAADVGTLTYNATSNQATLLFTGLFPDGKYRLAIQATDIANAAGVTASGSPIVFNFHVLRGDANHDARVNFDDLVILAQNYGETGRTFGQGNFDYSADTKVDFDDLVMLAQRYNVNLNALNLTAQELPASSVDKTTDKRGVTASGVLPELM